MPIILNLLIIPESTLTPSNTLTAKIAESQSIFVVLFSESSESPKVLCILALPRAFGVDNGECNARVILSFRLNWEGHLFIGRRMQQQPGQLKIADS